MRSQQRRRAARRVRRRRRSRTDGSARSVAAQTARVARAPGLLRFGADRSRRRRRSWPASPSCCPATSGDADGPVSGTVFKVERGPAGEKIAYVRMFSGTVRIRDRLTATDKVTAISVFDERRGRARRVGGGRPDREGLGPRRRPDRRRDRRPAARTPSTTSRRRRWRPSSPRAATRTAAASGSRSPSWPSRTR